MLVYLILIISIVIAYIIGSVPTSYIFGRLLKGIDIREYGSGTVGAPNTFRVLGKAPGIMVLLLDIFKGTIVVTLVAACYYQLMVNMAGSSLSAVPLSWQMFKIVLGLAVIAGHIWTVFLSFKGGKGVATSAGVIIGLDPLTVSIAIIIFLAVFVLTRYVSLGSIIAATCLPVLIVIRHAVVHRPVPIPFLVFSMIIAMVVVYRHKANISRLLRGEENKVNFSK